MSITSGVVWIGQKRKKKKKSKRKLINYILSVPSQLSYLEWGVVDSHFRKRIYFITLEIIIFKFIYGIIKRIKLFHIYIYIIFSILYMKNALIHCFTNIVPGLVGSRGMGKEYNPHLSSWILLYINLDF